jgi:hypothetical protein
MRLVYRLLVFTILAFLVGSIAGALRSGGLTLSLSADALTTMAVIVDFGILALILYEDFIKPFLCAQGRLLQSS